MTLYEITTHSHIGNDLSNELVNVFHYLSNEALPSSLGALGLVSNFWEALYNTDPGITSIQSVDTVLDYIVCRSPYDPSVFAVDTNGETGDSTGSVLPVFMAWSFRALRTRGDMRNGYKRFSQLTEGQIENGEPTSTMRTLLGNVANALNAPIGYQVGQSVYSAVPVIVKRVKVIIGDKVHYRLPVDPFELVYYTATWEYHQVTTQNTRKR